MGRLRGAVCPSLESIQRQVDAIRALATVAIGFDQLRLPVGRHIAHGVQGSWLRCSRPVLAEVYEAPIVRVAIACKTR